ncbi:MAG: TIGR03915 family putative DNA repair protein [Clostridia bacterium]|nr:TIGR03915 family putative DNA repair protein [Clostridia bacterium]
MKKRQDAVYIYDGSYEGLLCAVFNCYIDKYIPSEITAKRDTLLPCTYINTEKDKAARVMRGVRSVMGKSAEKLIKRAYLSDCADKGVAVAEFIIFGMKTGFGAVSMLATPCVDRMHRIARSVAVEAHRNLEFIRFSEVNGALVSVIQPSHSILPIIAPHFITRFPCEKFFIYDKVHKLGFVHDGGRNELLPIDGFEPDEISKDEERYRALWHVFYNTIEIKARHNERCRLNHMPKRFWEDFMYNPPSDEGAG